MWTGLESNGRPSGLLKEALEFHRRWVMSRDCQLSRNDFLPLIVCVNEIDARHKRAGSRDACEHEVSQLPYVTDCNVAKVHGTAAQLYLRLIS
jgi:hypothetical protein